MNNKGFKIVLPVVLVFGLLGVLLISTAAVVGTRYLLARQQAIIEAPAVSVSLADVTAVATQIETIASSEEVLKLSTISWAGPNSNPLQGGPDDQLIFGGTYTLGPEEVLEGNLVVFGGVATLEEGSLVNGDVALVGGSVQVDGTVSGDIFILGGLADLSGTALIEGDVNAIGGHVEYENRDSVLGDINTGIPVSPSVTLPDPIFVPQVDTGIGWIGETLWFFFQVFLWTVLAVLVVLFLPKHTERSARVAISQPIISVGLGLMTVVVVPILLLMFAITIIGIPVSLMGFFLLAVAWAFGLISVGTEVGRRLAIGFNQEWAPAVMAGIGTMLLVLVVNSIAKVVPCIGWIAPAFVGMLGLGAALLTRFGTQDYPQDDLLPQNPPAAPLSPIDSPDSIELGDEVVKEVLVEDDIPEDQELNAEAKLVEPEEPPEDE